jgi:FKBP-type peptidyl-prolyl cis-trans isomerase FkpA
MNNNPVLKPVVIVVGLLLGLFLVGKFLAPKDAPPVPESTPPPAKPLMPEVAGGKPADAEGEKAKLGPSAVTTKTGLKYEDLKVGAGKEAKDGTSVDVHYTGWLTNGTKFDSSKDRNEPFQLSLPGQVIAGWNEGIPGMKEGGVRKLVIPASLGYGEQGMGEAIPPGSTLVFEVELLKVN